MPALYLFGKRTLLAGDDLQLPAVLTIGARIVQVVGLALPIAIFVTQDAGKSGESLFFFLITDPSHDAICTHSHYYPLFNSLHLFATLLFGIVSVFLELRIWHWSCQGTPTIREPRSTKVQLLLERKFSYLTMFLIGIVFLYITGIGFAQTYLVCHAEEEKEEDERNTSTLWIGTHVWWILSVLLIFSQVAELFLISLFLARLVLQQDDNGDGVWNHYNSHHYRNQSQELWTDRCHWMCECLSISTCCLFGGQDLVENHNPAVSTNNIYQQVAIALAEFLETRGTLDIVPSDLITGLLMLQKLQEQRKLKAQIQVIRSSQQQRFTTLVDEGGPGIQMEPQNSSSNKKSLTRRVRSGNTPEPQSRNTSFSQRAPSSGSLSASGSSSSSLMGLETSHLVPPNTLCDPLQTNIYRRVSGADASHYAPRARQVLDPNSPMDQGLLQEGARMAKYALAIYTWMLYVFVHPISGFPNIICTSCKLCCSSKQSYRNRRRTQSDSSLLSDDDEFPTTIGDNMCHWHKSALLLVAQLDHTDLVYAQFENRFSLMPYCILLDHQTQCVIISIRGSLSLEDLVTDALIDPESCEGLGNEFGFDAQGQYCHAGVVACVKNIYQDLQRHRLLDSLAEDFPNYGLRLVGHSMGAAQSTLLGYILKSQYNDLKVYNFSPPGCTMTWELATQCSEWTTTFVLDSDLVPRLSVLAMEDLRDEVLQLVGNLKVPKHQVFETIFATCTAGPCFGRSSEPDDVDLEQSLIDVNRKINEMLGEPVADTLYHRQLQEFLRIQAELKRSRGDSRTLRLYPPGRMIHLLKTGEDSGCSHAMKKCMTCCMSNSGFRYTPIYISNDDLNEIVVCPTMGTDHFVDRMYFELRNIASQFERRYQDEIIT
ncbi:MAG: hypothetical protein SGBAC_000512 [Bacillariaceae sp.]